MANDISLHFTRLASQFPLFSSHFTPLSLAIKCRPQSLLLSCSSRFHYYPACFGPVPRRFFCVSASSTTSQSCEAALSSARLGAKTLLLTLTIDRIAWQPCNPAGGLAKSQLVHEVNALGGEIGKIADRWYLQKRVLNVSRGPPVRALRAQTDKREYAFEMKKIVGSTPNLSIREAIVMDILVGKNDNVEGVRTFFSMHLL